MTDEPRHEQDTAEIERQLARRRRLKYNSDYGVQFRAEGDNEAFLKALRERGHKYADD